MAGPRFMEDDSDAGRAPEQDVPLRGAWCLAGIRPGYLPVLTLNCSTATPL